MNSQEFLRVVLALETLFMEWSCDLMMQEALIRVGIVYLLFQQLKLFYRSIYSNREINKVRKLCTHNYICKDNVVEDLYSGNYISQWLTCQDFELPDCQTIGLGD